MAGYDPRELPARLRYTALERLLTHDLAAEDADDWRAMLRGAVWNGDINCSYSGIVGHVETGEFRPLDAVELRCILDIVLPTPLKTLSGTMDSYYTLPSQNGLPPESEAAPPILNSLPPEQASLLDTPFAALDLDGPWEGGLSSGCGFPIGILRDDATETVPASTWGGDAEVLIQTEFSAEAVLNWLGSLRGENSPTPVLLAWIGAALNLPGPDAVRAKLAGTEKAAVSEQADTIRTDQRKITQNRGEDKQTLDPFPDPEDDGWRNDQKMELKERRMRAISWAIHSKEFNRMNLEKGDKGLIEKYLKDSKPDLFKGTTVFSAAWKEGSKRKWWRVADYRKYTKRRQ